jgi:hypothetical protein
MPHIRSPVGEAVTTLSKECMSTAIMYDGTVFLLQSLLRSRLVWMEHRFRPHFRLLSWTWLGLAVLRYDVALCMLRLLLRSDPPLALRAVAFLAILFVAYRLLFSSAMGVRDMLSKLQGDSQKPFKAPPPPIPHATRPGAAAPSSGNAPSGKPFVTVQRGQLVLEDGTPFRFASLNAPELLDGHEFEVEDTMRTLAGFGRRVTRTYTLKIEGTSPHFGDAGHINGWDHARGDWIYDESKWQKVKQQSVRTRLSSTDAERIV